MSEKKPLLMVIDGHSLLYRAFFAIPPLTAPDGRPTNAVYGFLRMLFRLMRTEKPDYLTVALDAPGPTFRHRLYAEYKAKRAKAPEPLRPQVPLLKDVLKAIGIAVWEQEGYEADDLMGVAAGWAGKCNVRVLLVTGDLDALQFVNDHVAVLMPQKGLTQAALYDRSKVAEELGIPPERIPDFKGLAGDPSDNIPGIPGIGPKIAQELLKQFGSLEEVLANAEKVTSRRLRENLIRFADQARLSKRLATVEPPLCADEMNLESFAVGKWRPACQGVQLILKLGMKRLLDDLQVGLPEQETLTVNARILTSKEDWDAFISTIKGGASVAVSWEGSDGTVQSIALYAGDQVGLVIGDSATEAVSAPPSGSLFRPAGSPVPSDQLRKWLVSLLKDPSIEKAAHDWKQLLRSIRLVSADPSLGLQPFGFSDTILMAYLLHPGQSKYELSDVVAERQLLRPVEIRRDVGEGGLPPEALEVCRKAVLTGLALPALVSELRDEDLWEVYERLELPLLFVLADMEEYGVAVDAPYLQQLGKEMVEEAKKVQQDIFRLSGEPFNILSAQQLSEILFKKLNLPRPGRTPKGKPSTGQAVLEALAQIHPIAGKILEYRELEKLRSTFVQGLLEAVDRDGRVHTHYDQTGTATGRLASSHPNLQNIPIRSRWGKRIRRAFIAPKGRRLLSADYSQIELRILAHLSQDEGLCQAFAEGRDIHAEAASGVFGVPHDQVTPEMRRKAKILNFGIVYGISPQGLGQQLGVSIAEAQFIIDKYFQRFPKVKEYQERAEQFAKENRYVMTLLKRKRWIPEIDHADDRVREAAKRAAINTPVQGTSADIMKLAMVQIWRALKEGRYDAKMTMQVHDELVLEVRAEDVRDVACIVKRKMESAVRLVVPLIAEVKVGDTWAEMNTVL